MGEGEGEGEGEGDMDVIIKITCYILPIDCLLIVLLIALDAHMFSQNGYGSGTKAQNQKMAFVAIYINL